MKLNANTSCGQLLFYAPSWLDACCFSEIPHFGTPLIHSMQAHFWETFAKQSEVRSCETPLKNKNDGHSCHGTFLRHASEALLWDSRLRRFGKTIVGGTFLRHSCKRLRWDRDRSPHHLAIPCNFLKHFACHEIIFQRVHWDPFRWFTIMI